MSFFDTKGANKNYLTLLKASFILNTRYSLDKTYHIIFAPASLIVHRFELNSGESNTTVSLSLPIGTDEFSCFMRVDVLIVQGLEAK